VAGPCEHGNEPSGSKRCEELTDELLATQEGSLLLGVREIYLSTAIGLTPGGSVTVHTINT